MSYLILIVVIVVFAFIINYKLNKSLKKIGDKIEKRELGLEEEVETKSQKHWSKEELVIIAYYIIYEKTGKNDMKVVASIAEGLGRSIASVLRKISIMENIPDSDSYNLIKDVYAEFSILSKDQAEQLLNETMTKIM